MALHSGVTFSSFTVHAQWRVARLISLR
jgi:hypothetical protein